jgi:excinuclease ABC subunit A
MEHIEQDAQAIEVFGAREHNLKNIDVSIPGKKLVVITGLSGSGKSSLAFDTIYAEGQRRYMETFGAYSRQFLGNLERPNVDKISGLSPVIAIEQKTTNKNPRSTVGTITEVYDFFRLLYARVADAYSYVTGKQMVKMTEQQILEHISESFKGKTILILAPVVKGRKGHYRELFEQVRKQGYLKIRVDGELQNIEPKMQVDRYKIHDIELLIDAIDVEEKSQKRLQQSISLALKQGKGVLKIILENDPNKEEHNFSKFLMCADSGISYNEPQPNTFSYNSPYGSCPKCTGLGYVIEFDIENILPNKNLSIFEGGIAPLGEYKNNWTFQVLKTLSEKYNFNLSTPIKNLTEEQLDVLLNGTEELLNVKYEFSTGYQQTYKVSFDGIVKMLEDQNSRKSEEKSAEFDAYRTLATCPECNGMKLKKESLHFKIDDKNISEISEYDLAGLMTWVQGLNQKLNDRQLIIADDILKEIELRLKFLLDVGLEYLTLNRLSKTLSGGEAQRIRLATQIGSQLVNVLYILDEPSIGLHQRDNARLIQALKDLKDLGNSILVVEHDKDMILEADYVLDMGPAAGKHGGKIIAHGTPKEILSKDTITSNYLNGKVGIEIPKKRRTGNGNHLILKGAKGNNLKNVDLKIPLGTLTCITGVSGSGKSTLINETLYPILNQHFFNAKKKPLAYDSIKGLEHLDKVIEIDQSPIGRVPRSNPSTYTGVFSDIRNLFVQLPESKIRGYKAGRFSFNVKGGRCEACEGAGLKVIEMNFLPDVQVHCDVCQGNRYNKETLEVRYKGKSISDVLNLSVEEAVEFFDNVPSILRKIKTLHDVGLGYITLGQASTTLSGGEAQRVKLATELSKKDTGNTIYILDEPTTGLHFEDIRILMLVIQKLVNKGNTVVIIEHNLDVIKTADYLIDLGPEGGHRGGDILFSGTPEQMVKSIDSPTAIFLKKELH